MAEMTDEERALWREIAAKLDELRDLHVKRTGHSVWRHLRHWDIGFRCFGGCDDGT